MLSTRQVILRKCKSMIVVGSCGIASFCGIGIWTGNEKFYDQFLNPVFNKIDPETSHRIAVTVAKYQLLRSSSIDNPKNLVTKVGPLEFSNPIGLAAGFDKSAECISGMSRMGLGWVEIGSVTPLPQEGNPKPRVFRLPEDSAVINRYGFNNDGHHEVHLRVQEFKKENPKYIVGVNLGANKDSNDRVEDYCKGIQVFSDSADYFVVNVSSPNTPNLRDLQKTESLDHLLKRVITTRNSQIRHVPVFLKIAPDLSDEDVKSICKSVTKKDTKVDGLIISNTTISRESLKSENALRSQIGGLSGKPLEKMSTEMVGKFYKELKGEIPIIGVGGIWEGKDAYNKICAGANAVQLYTALAYKGPSIVGRIKLELSSLLQENGYNSINEAVGSDHTK